MFSRSVAKERVENKRNNQKSPLISQVLRWSMLKLAILIPFGCCGAILLKLRVNSLN